LKSSTSLMVKWSKCVSEHANLFSIQYSSIHSRAFLALLRSGHIFNPRCVALTITLVASPLLFSIIALVGSSSLYLSTKPNFSRSVTSRETWPRSLPRVSSISAKGFGPSPRSNRISSWQSLRLAPNFSPFPESSSIFSPSNVNEKSTPNFNHIDTFYISAVRPIP